MAIDLPTYRSTVLHYTSVYLGTRFVGEIKPVKGHGSAVILGYAYYPKRNFHGAAEPSHGEVFNTVDEVKQSLEGE